MRIAAVDPGTRAVGYCVLEPHGRRLEVVEMGTIRPRSHAVHQRLHEIFTALDRIFRRHHPKHVAVEKAYVGRNAASALRLGEGRGVAMAAAARSGASVFEYTASEAKAAAAASGSASKSAVQRAVQLILALDRPPAPDAADAAALAICHATRLAGA